MKKYILKSIERDRSVLYLTLTPKRPGYKAAFEPGQYATIGFRGSNSHLSPMRCFSITSPEGSGDLQFATRIGGDFTRALADLNIGSKMYIQGPFGNFTIDEKFDKNVVMIAGGIGITPFMSMIRTATKSRSSLKITLMYSCRKGQGIPFHDELRHMEEINPNLRVVIFVTDETAKPEIPRMLSGRMTERHIDQVTKDPYYTNSTYFICGPKGFTETTESILLDKRIDKDRIVIESFTQASKTTLGGYNLVKVTYGFAGSLLVASMLFITFVSHGYHTLVNPASANTDSSNSVNQSTDIAPSSNAQANSSETTPSSSTQVNSQETAPSNSNTNSSNNDQQNNNYKQPVTSVS